MCLTKRSVSSACVAIKKKRESGGVKKETHPHLRSHSMALAVCRRTTRLPYKVMRELRPDCTFLERVDGIERRDKPRYWCQTDKYTAAASGRSGGPLAVFTLESPVTPTLKALCGSAAITVITTPHLGRLEAMACVVR